jgi:TonB family protein
MMLAALLMLSMQGPQAVSVTEPKPGPVVLDCALAMAQGANALASEVCRAEQNLKQGEAAAKGSPDERRYFERAADDYREVERSATESALKAAALEMLARIYDIGHLNEPPRVERVLRDLSTVVPSDLTVLFRLARVQEDQQELDAAEATLLSARRLQPATAAPNRMLAQFYARRVSEMSTAARQLEAQLEPVQPGQRDRDGFYHVGGNVQAPRKLEGGPPYPEDARNAGVSGPVIVELSLDETGTVRNARIAQSIPLLDAAALDTVRRWHYEPTIVNGRPVPIKMNVTVNFNLPKP